MEKKKEDKKDKDDGENKFYLTPKFDDIKNVTGVGQLPDPIIRICLGYIKEIWFDIGPFKSVAQLGLTIGLMEFEEQVISWDHSYNGLNSAISPISMRLEYPGFKDGETNPYLTNIETADEPIKCSNVLWRCSKIYSQMNGGEDRPMEGKEWENFCFKPLSRTIKVEKNDVRLDDSGDVIIMTFSSEKFVVEETD
jgi:hypothetical protein